MHSFSIIFSHFNFLTELISSADHALPSGLFKNWSFPFYACLRWNSKTPKSNAEDQLMLHLYISGI